MFTTLIISFREFLEALLIIGVFLGISRKLHLKKELEIGLAACVGITISLILISASYLVGDHARTILTEKNADYLESYLLIFSGLFIIYVVFSLHNVINRTRGMKLLQAHKKLQEDAFDLSLFCTIVFLVAREGFEIALFTASATLFSALIQNIIGLLLGFGLATTVGLLTFFAYIKFPIGKVFKVTEYMIVLLGSSLTQNGITKLLQSHFNIHLSTMLSFHLQFLPREDSFIGTLLQGFFGIDQGFSAVRLAIMLCYMGILYVFFIKQRAKPAVLK